MPATSTRIGEADYSLFDYSVIYDDPIKASSLEILLLAIGVLFLVVLMGVLLWHGYRKRVRERESINGHVHHGSPCLWQGVFPAERNYEPLLAPQPHGDDSPSFIEKVRKRSKSYTRALQHELRDITRTLASESDLEPSFKEDLEVGMGAGSVSDRSETWTDRRWSSGAEVDPGGKARRRISSFVRPEDGIRRVSYEHAVSDG